MKREELLKEIDGKRALFGTFFAFNNRLQTAGDNFYQEITCKQFFLLICIHIFQEDPPTINELSEVMGSSHQNVKQIVNKLEANGFLEVRRDEQDKRKLRVHKTDKMEQFSKKYARQEKEFLERFYEGVSDDEVAGMYKTMMQLENNLIKIKEAVK